METSAVARYRRQKIDEVGEETSELGYWIITGNLQEGVAREEEEMVKR